MITPIRARKIIMIKVKSALRIEMEILLVRNETKDCNEKPGRRQRPKNKNIKLIVML